MPPFTATETIKEKKKKKSKDKNLGEIQKSQDFQLESSTKLVKLDTSKWPLLLKVYRGPIHINP